MTRFVKLVAFALINLLAENFAFPTEAERVQQLGHYTSLFALEVISTGLGTHLIRGDSFDIPARDQHIIAIAAAKTWFTLPHIKQVSDLVKRAAQNSAEELLQSSGKMSGRIYKYLFEKVESKLKLEPKVNAIYDREKSKLLESPTDIPTLYTGIINIDGPENVTQKLQDAFLKERNLRIVLINTIFQEYGFADTFQAGKKDTYVLARAIVELAKRFEEAELLNEIYRRAVNEVLESEGDKLYMQTGADIMNTKLLPALIRSFKDDPTLDAELTVMKEYLSRGGLPPGT